MFYGDFSFFGIIFFIVAFVYLNGKINRLSARIEKVIKGGVKSSTSASASASAPSLADLAGLPGMEPTPANGATAVQTGAFPSSASVSAPAPKVDGEEKGGQWIGKIGILAIVLGVSFFLKWAFDNNIIDPIGRIMLGIMGGSIFVVVGQFLRKKYLVYSDIVSGGGIAILYLSIYASFAFYNFIGSTTAGLLMLAVTALSVTLSVIGGTQQLAVLGIIGGFATPMLLSTGVNNFGGLMSYLTVLDIGILAVAIFKKWNRLNLLGFLGTVFWSYAWFWSFYTPADLFKVFLVFTIFFVIYLIAGIVHNVLWKKLSKSEDLFLITGNAALYALASYTILNPLYHGIMGFFMFFLAVFYLFVAYIAYRVNPEDKTLNLYLPGIAIVFLTLAMPIQFSGKWITLAWLVESALLVAMGSVVRRHSTNVFGLIVFGVGLIRLFTFDMGIGDLALYTPIFNSRFFLTVVAIVVAYLVGYMLMRHLGEGDEEGRKQGAAFLFVVAHLMSLFIVTSEINAHYGKAIFAGQKAQQTISTNFYQNGGGDVSERMQNDFRQKETTFYAEQKSTQNRRNTVVSIMWALYAVALTAFGFGAKRRLVRLLGLVLLFVTAFKVLIDVWALGEVYRIISSISFGVIALLVSFAYAKWKHRLQEVL